MFIELTDQLRCPAEHPEAFLVLIPHRMEGRRVVEGVLGCPVCEAEYPIAAGVAAFGLPPALPGRSAGEPSGAPDAAALLAFLGLEGPGGYVALIGAAAGAAADLAALLPGVHLALVNPLSDPRPMPAASVLVAPRLPLKARSLRGIVIGWPWATGAAWVEAGVGAVLPGLRAVGQGEPPALPGLELLGAAGGWWVGRRS